MFWNSLWRAEENLENLDWLSDFTISRSCKACSIKNVVSHGTHGTIMLRSVAYCATPFWLQDVTDKNMILTAC